MPSTLLETARTANAHSAGSGRIPAAQFAFTMAIVSSILIFIAVSGSFFTGIHANIIPRVLAVLVLTAVLAPVPAYWHQKGNIEFRDSALILPWIVLVTITLPFLLLVAARMRMPLQDALLAKSDRVLGVNVSHVVWLANTHWVGHAINRCYPLLLPLLVLAIFVPTLTGRLRDAQRFMIANIIAFAIAVPLFAMFPALGPWVSYHFSATPDQTDCQNQIMSLREPVAYFFQSQDVGIVSFPSFHVIWAVLCAAALWGFRRLRWVVVTVSSAIAFSTITTGWHYFSDLVAGVIVAVLSLMIASYCLGKPVDSP